MHVPITKLLYTLSEIIAIRQFRTYHSSNNIPSGLITWAWLSEFTIERLSAISLEDAHPSEWNEGNMLCLFCVAISDAVKEQMEGDIYRNLFPDESTILLYVPAKKDAAQQLIKANRNHQKEDIYNWLIANSQSDSLI